MYDINDQTAIGLNTLNLAKVELSLGVSTDSATVTTSINKQALNVISNTLKEFNLDDSLNSNIKTYTEEDMLEYANSLINKGALEIIQQGGDAKVLDDYLTLLNMNPVRELMGHSDLKMTLRYAHLAPEHKAAAVNLIC